MALYAALLRAVNVGGTGRLPMSELRAICEAAGFREVRTLLASGNAMFESDAPPERVVAELELRLERHFGRPCGVILRTAEELAEVLARNPFPSAAPDRTVAIFLPAPPGDPLAGASGRAYEQIAAGTREIYVHYPGGLGRSKLRLPAARDGTARNMNTLAKLVAAAG